MHDFLGRSKNEVFIKLGNNLIELYSLLRCRMSVEGHSLHRVDFIRPKLGDVSEEHGERFCQDNEATEKRCQYLGLSSTGGTHVESCLIA